LFDRDRNEIWPRLSDTTQYVAEEAEAGKGGGGGSKAEVRRGICCSAVTQQIYHTQ